MTTVANDVLTSASEFCRFLADARSFGIRGFWQGSAYQSHPCGLIAGVFKLTNRWTTSNSCSVEITDGDGWGGPWTNDPRVSGNPHPKPINGCAVTVWANGEWTSPALREALEQKLIAIIESAQMEILAANTKGLAVLAQANKDHQQEQAALIAAALAKATAQTIA